MRAQVVEALPQPRRVEAAPVRQLHDVLVAHQVVGVLRHRGQCGVRGTGATFRRGEVTRPQHAVDAELQERPRLLDGAGERSGVGARQVPGVAAAG